MLYLLLAEGFEETEAIAPLDVIRRAELPVTTVGITGSVVTGAHNIPVKADIALDEVSLGDMDGVILPGGMPGTLNLQKNAKVQELLEYCEKENKLIAAICAAPMIPGELGMLKGKCAVCFPGFEEHLEGAELQNVGVVCDGNMITAKGAGVALQFGAAIVDYFTADSHLPDRGQRILAQIQFSDHV